MTSTLDQARDLAAQAQRAGIRTAVGLQARFSPTLAYARELITGGHLGEILATTLLGSGHAWGPVTSSAYSYLYDTDSGASTLSVVALHALDGLQFVLGEIDLDAVTATMAVRRPQVYLADTDATLPVSAPDHLAVTGLLSGGGLASVFYRGGVSRAANLRWEINGSHGDLLITAGPGAASMQVAELRLAAGYGAATNLSELDIPQRYLAPISDLPVPARNVALLYAQFANDLRHGTCTVPDFAHGLQRHELIDAIETAAAQVHADDPRPHSPAAPSRPGPLAPGSH